jgi:hypothetical protein
MNKPIYLTTNRLIYNCARIDHRHGRITDEEYEYKKNKWLEEYNNDDIQSKLAKKFSTKEK